MADAAIFVGWGASVRGRKAKALAVPKQVYIYGSLDRSPTEFNRNFGMAWGIGGWLLTPFLQKIGFDAAQKLRERVAAEIKTTFASSYTKEVSDRRIVGLHRPQAAPSEFRLTGWATDARES